VSLVARELKSSMTVRLDWDYTMNAMANRRLCTLLRRLAFTLRLLVVDDEAMRVQVVRVLSDKR
jgi:hypothetical protein